MKFQQKSFAVGVGSKEFREGHDRIFGKGKASATVDPVADEEGLPPKPTPTRQKRRGVK